MAPATITPSNCQGVNRIRAAYIEPYTSADPPDLHPALSRYPLADYDWAELWTQTASPLPDMDHPEVGGPLQGVR